VIELTGVVLTIAVLLVVIGVLQPLAERAKIPATVLLAAVGVGIGALASFLLYTPMTDRFNEVVAPVVDMPLRSSTFIYVFLPLLLFQAAITIDVARMREDAAPILLLAVVAVVVTTAVVGLSLSGLFAVPLVACLLLGSVIATTDPAAVVTIFRDIGAPARLSRLVEGESLLNDAAAIALFTLLLGLLIEGRPLDWIVASGRFASAFAGGIAVGYAAGRMLVFALRRLGNLRAAETTMTLAAPYLVFIACERFLDVSGVVAVVTLGLCMSAWGKAVLAPENWQHLQNVWEQIAFWAGSLVFILAALLVPKLMGEVGLRDAAMILTAVAAALAARAAVLFGLLPALSLVRLTKPVDRAYKTAILWGGLRGAVTLALALAVVENAALPAEVKQMVAVTATGFVLFTLFVNGTTLRAVIRRLRLDQLTARDQALRDQVLALSLLEVADAVREAGGRYRIPPVALDPVLQSYDERMATAAVGGSAAAFDALQDRERLAVALTALANRERELILEHRGHHSVSAPVGDRLLQHADRLVEAARGEGRTGYARAARRIVAYRAAFRLAHFIHRNLHLDGPLARQMAQRFETLQLVGLALSELARFNEMRLKPLFGIRIGGLTGEILDTRAAAANAAMEAMRLQYPRFADALAQRFVLGLAQRRELRLYETLRDEGLLGREVHEDLKRTVHALQRAQRRRPRLDLGMKIPDMVGRLEMFAGLSEQELKRICRLFRQQLALPGEFIVRRGERGNKMYFVSSGAVEVRLPGQTLRRGRGDFFGEIALLTRRRRIADIVALGYCELLSLDEARFTKFLEVNPDIRRHIEETARCRAIELPGLAADPAPVPRQSE
jgi:CPA1 family monovalent cation:H+ antiporter